MDHLSEFPVVIERTVSWGDMDAFQHVNNVQYFRFFEDARIAYFEAVDVYESDATGLEGAGPILAATSCRFKAPLTYPDEIAVGARVTETGSDRFTLEYAIASNAADRIVAVGDSVVVSYDYDAGEKIDLPAAWLEAIDRLES